MTPKCQYKSNMRVLWVILFMRCNAKCWNGSFSSTNDLVKNVDSMINVCRRNARFVYNILKLVSLPPFLRFGNGKIYVSAKQMLCTARKVVEKHSWRNYAHAVESGNHFSTLISTLCITLYVLSWCSVCVIKPKKKNISIFRCVYTCFVSGWTRPWLRVTPYWSLSGVGGEYDNTN